MTHGIYQIMSPFYCFQLFFFTVCVHLFTLFSYVVYYSDRLYYFNANIQKEYDYIIVGSGTAGSVIAHRLATETNHSFIVLEAGSRGHSLLEIPVLGPFLHRSVFDWQFESVPQNDACLAMDSKKCRLPQGKILGGSSKLNNMIHIRGNISHYVDWFHGLHTGEYLTKQLQFIEDNILYLDNVQYQSDLSDAVIKAAKELGYNTSFTKSKVSQKNGKRWSTSNKVSTKYVFTNALVENIIFEHNIARGVNAVVFGNKHKIYAKRMVIVSAGAINTPKILQLSGIGPENILTSLDIAVIKALPVGKNLQDHVATGLDLVLFNQSVSIDAFDMINPINTLQYFFNGKGPLTTPGCEAVGFISTQNQKQLDLQFMVLPVGLASDRGSLFRKNLGVSDHVWHNYFVKIFDKYVATFLPIVMHPKSRGEVYITSSDPKQLPVFDPKYFSNKEDLDVIISGLKIVKKLVESDAMKNIGAYMNPNLFPGCENHEMFSDSYLECYVRHLTLTSYHPVGTCSMGLLDSKSSVVDTSFKVLGVEKLYVADASVLPTLPSGNINAAVAMMASVFFDTNIRAQSKVYKIKNLYCKNSDILYEIFYDCCVASKY